MGFCRKSNEFWFISFFILYHTIRQGQNAFFIHRVVFIFKKIIENNLKMKLISNVNRKKKV